MSSKLSSGCVLSKRHYKEEDVNYVTLPVDCNYDNNFYKGTLPYTYNQKVMVLINVIKVLL